MSLTVLGIVSKFSSLGWVFVLLGVVVAFFSLLIFIEDTQKRSNQFSLLFSTGVFLWGVSFAFFDASRDTSFASDALIALYGIGGLLAPLALFWAYVFSDEKHPDLMKKGLIVLVPYFFIFYFLLTPGLVVDYSMSTGELVFGLGFLFYALYILIVLGVGLLYLVKKYRISAGIFSFEAESLIVIFSLAGITSMTFFLLVPIIYSNLDLFWIGYSATALLVIAAGISAIRYNFWSFKVIATEFFISFVGLILLIELFFATSLFNLLLRVAIAVMILFSSFFLVGSVKREFESRDKIARLLRELDQINARLRVLDKKKSQFLSTASHHLRDPLTSIQGYASMLMEGSFGELTPMTKDALGKIFESSKRLVTVISDFLDISNIESGDIKYVFADVDMKQLVEGLVVDMQTSAERAGLKLAFVAENSNTQYVTVGDLGKIRQVVSNLIDNSIKYTPRGSVNVKLSKSVDGKKILFSVSDTGIGMSKDTLNKIFKKFSRAEGVSKVYTEGTGLGLYVAKEIVKKHEGHIWAESAGENMGSSFNLELEAKPL